MPTTTLSTALLTVALLVPARPAHAQITDLERQRLVSHMQMTASWLEDEVAGLSPAQLTFRPAANAWSILEVLDHIVVVQPIYWKDLQGARPVAGGRAGLMSDVDVLWYGIDRTNREAAIKSELPSHTVTNAAEAMKEYRAHHARLLEYVRTTTDHLRGRLVERQQSDAYQWALLISTHEQRHILQIRDIKANPKYPAK